MDTIEYRVTKLESRCRRLRFALIATVIVGVGAVLAGASAPARAPTVIRADSFELRKNPTDLCGGCLKTQVGGSVLELCDLSGHVRLRLEAGVDGGTISFLDEKGQKVGAPSVSPAPTQHDAGAHPTQPEDEATPDDSVKLKVYLGRLNRRLEDLRKAQDTFNAETAELVRRFNAHDIYAEVLMKEHEPKGKELAEARTKTEAKIDEATERLLRLEQKK
jgi:hypothetical protein